MLLVRVHARAGLNVARVHLPIEPADDAQLPVSRERDGAQSIARESVIHL